MVRSSLALGIAALLVVGCGIDPDEDGIFSPVFDVTEDDVEQEDTQLDDVGEPDTESDLDVEDSSEPVVTCLGHCDCEADEFCSNTGTCQINVLGQPNYCCEDSGAACPTGVACNVPGESGTGGVCD